MLFGIDLDLRTGDFAVLVGKSGSGNTTLRNIIGLFDTPTALSISGTDELLRTKRSGGPLLLSVVTTLDLVGGIAPQRRTTIHKSASHVMPSRYPASTSVG